MLEILHIFAKLDQCGVHLVDYTLAKNVKKF